MYKKQLFDNVEQYTILKQKRLQQKCGNEHKNGDETNVNDNSEDVKRLKLDQNKSWYFYHLHKWLHFKAHLTIGVSAPLINLPELSQCILLSNFVMKWIVCLLAIYYCEFKRCNSLQIFIGSTIFCFEVSNSK